MQLVFWKCCASMAASSHRLLSGETHHYGLTKLWECGRLDLSVECLVLDERFHELFEDRELKTARQRLREYGFDPEKHE